MKQKLQLRVASYSTAGVKSINEDAATVSCPQDDYTLTSKGALALVADGVSSAEAGREASETAARRFVEEYYNTPDTWSVARAGEKILSALNLKLYRKSHEFATSTKGYLCTFSAVVVKGRTAHFFHVGDSRIFHLSRASGPASLSCLTRDHAVMMGAAKPTLTRALGMDNRLHIDYGSQALNAGDLLLISTDGVHDFLDEATIQAVLLSGQSPEQMVKSLCERALAAGSDDNISAAIVMVDALPEESLEDYHAKLTRLPFPPELQVGEKIDGYEVTEILFASPRSQLYRVTDVETGASYVMKTPSHNYEDDTSYIDRFIQEEWIGKRIQSDRVVRVANPGRAKHFLYYLMDYVPGEGLDKWIEKHSPPSPKQAIAIIKDIAEGLQAFHQSETVHQDLRPANIIITPENRAVIVDFGSVYVAGVAEQQRPLVHNSALGTASYSDPLYIQGSNSGIQGDVYALATITYEVFTGHLPYGHQIEECRTAFDFNRLRYRPAAMFNPVVPIWFDSALKKGVAFELSERYQTVDELLRDLQTPNPEFLKDEVVTSSDASKLVFWQILSGVWFVTLLLVIYLFVKVG